MSVRFGLAYDFRNPERWGRPWAEVFHALLEQIEYVDTLGFDSIWITEHHFVPDGYAHLRSRSWRRSRHALRT